MNSLDTFFDSVLKIKGMCVCVCVYLDVIMANVIVYTCYLYICHLGWGSGYKAEKGRIYTKGRILMP